ncbi:MAG: hypothetical protein NC433_06085 [Clostridiales bacterium]|nr:hypothetical protein [Clostridiales bacterium]
MRKSFLSRLSSLICVMVIGGCLIYAANMNKETGEVDGGFIASGFKVQVSDDEGILVARENVAKMDDGDNAFAGKKLTEDKKYAIEAGLKDAYAYNNLTNEEQTVYVEILHSLLEFEEDTELSTLNSDVVPRIFQCVLNDNPEIFYVNGYSYTTYTLADIPKKLTFTATYIMDRAAAEEKQILIDGYVNQCLSGIPQEADEYETVKYIYEYLIEHTEYDSAAEDSQNICSVFIDGKSVCQGYAKATQYLLQRAGISATLVLGKVSSGEGHAWNLVKIDGNWYYVDTTWGDASYRTQSGDEAFPKQQVPVINYDYLCVTTEQIDKTHTIDNVVDMPACTSMEANYYVREGLYFADVDEDKLSRIFDDGYNKGSAYVTLKCASLEIYDRMYEKLIDNQEIFKYLDCPDGVVSYTASDEQCSMSFWL